MSCGAHFPGNTLVFLFFLPFSTFDSYYWHLLLPLTTAGIWSPKSRVGTSPVMKNPELMLNSPLGSPWSQPSLPSRRRPASALGSIGPFGSAIPSPLAGCTTPMSSARDPWRPPYLDDHGMDTVEWSGEICATGQEHSTYITPETRPSTAQGKKDEASGIRFRCPHEDAADNLCSNS